MRRHRPVLILGVALLLAAVAFWGALRWLRPEGVVRRLTAA